MVSLNTLVLQLHANLKDAANSANEYKWQRGLLYAEAKEHFKATKDFGNWLDEAFKGHSIQPDAKSVRANLMAITQYLSKEEFLALGYTKAAELMNKTLWKKHPSRMSLLATRAVTMSQRDIRQAIKNIKDEVAMGTYSAEPKSPIEQMAAMQAELERYRILESIRNSEYSGSDKFLSDVPEYRQAQYTQLQDCPKYALAFFGLAGLSVSEITEDVVKKAYRKLANQYHPDKGGLDSDMVIIKNTATFIIDSIRLKVLV